MNSPKKAPAKTPGLLVFAFRYLAYQKQYGGIIFLL